MSDYLQKHLPDWFREASLAPTPEQFTARRGAIADLAEYATKEGLGMAALAHGLEASEAAEAASALVQTHDPTFSPKSDKLEGCLLAGAALAQSFAEDADQVLVAAEAVLSAAFLDLQPAVAELPTLAHEYLSQRATSRRERGDLSTLTFPTVPKDGLPRAVAPESETTELEALADAVEAILRSFTSSQRNFRAALVNHLRATDEELDVAWWAFAGGSSRLLNMKKSKGKARAAVGLAAGIEFWDQLTLLPVFPSTTELLSRVLGTDADKPTQLRTAVEALVEADLAPDSLPDEGDSLLPILTAVRQCKNFNGKPAWVEALQRWNIDPQRESTGAALGRQVLRELTILT